MDSPRHARLRRLRAPAVAVALFAGCVVVTARADVVILKDGFVIQGEVRKEKERIEDPASGQLFLIARAGGFDFVDEGPKVVFFSTHNKQLGEISKTIKLRPDYRVYNNFIKGYKSRDPLPPGGDLRNISDFNDKWRRTLEIKMPFGTERIEQQIISLDPYSCRIVSSTHVWNLGMRTSELGPARVRKLLSTHPELVEADGKIDPLKRLAIAKFLLDAGWPVEAQQDVTTLKTEFTGEMTKEARDRLDQMQRELDQEVAEIIATESEKFLNAGRYQAAANLLGRFREAGIEPRTVDQATKLMARVKANRERHDNAERSLTDLIDEAALGPRGRPTMAVAGGAVTPLLPLAVLDTQLATLVDAARAVRQEIHPDTAGRIELFLNFAGQAERDREQGREPGKKSSELLASAVSGWVRGAIGSTTDPAAAVRAWQARTMALAYQREPGLNKRSLLLDEYLKSPGALTSAELVQVISLLPPAEPEDLDKRTGEAVPAGGAIPEGVFKYAVPVRGRARPIDAFVRLPAEYQHGRAYPVLIVLNAPGVAPEGMLGGLAFEADRNGYILLAPNWDSGLNGPYEYDGDTHVAVLATLRDLIRRFSVDNDRVFVFGLGEGANLALDVGLSHPDLFAGVLPWGSQPKWSNMFMYYWRNARHLPVFAVTGEFAGKSLELTRAVFNQWMGRGFPSLFTVYKGRQLEWFPAEVPVMFDWMNRKKRVHGAAALNLNAGSIDTTLAYQTMRPGDNRFYWLGVEELIDRYRIDVSGGVMNAVRNFTPAWVTGDIRNGNQIYVFSGGVRKINIWLSRDMIDWTKPVRVIYNRQPYAAFKPTVLEPDPRVLMESFHERGDRRLLFLNKIELRGN